MQLNYYLKFYNNNTIALSLNLIVLIACLDIDLIA